MRHVVFSLLVVSHCLLHAQTLIEVPIPSPSLKAVYNRDAAFADIDGDSDMDLLLVGNNNSGNGISQLYANDGTGNFIEVESPSFLGLAEGAVDFTDVDGDGDQDLVITGSDQAGTSVASLDRNDGAGGFTEDVAANLDGMMHSAIAFADIDGDQDLDLKLVGKRNASEYIANLYLNDGAGHFTVDNRNGFFGIANGAIAFADLDLDGDQDILRTGKATMALTGPVFIATTGQDGCSAAVE